MNGRAIRIQTRYGGTSNIAADSGPAIAMFLGTISPRSTCSTTTMVIATTNDTVCSTASDTPSRSNGASSRCATAGSPTRPRRIEHTVMPSWAPASISDRFWPAWITVTALRLPCSASASRRSRRAEISANSAATKKAFKASSSTVSRTPNRSLIRGLLVGAEPDQRDEVDAAAVHPLDGCQPVHRPVEGRVGVELAQGHRLALDGDVAELLQHQPADRLVLALGRPKWCLGVDLVDPQQAGHLPAVAHLDDVGGGVVVLVADVADDLLDQVLDRDHARGTAVFVDDQRGLQPVRPDLRHHRVAVEGGRHRGHQVHQGGQLGVRAVGPRYLEDLFDVDDADGLVEVALDDRESGVARLHGLVDQVCDGVVGLQRLDLRAGRHQLLGGAGAESQRAVHQRGR